MICPDVNLLLYAINESYPQHHQAKTWWDGVLSGTEKVALADVVVMGFLRLSTHRKIFHRPLRADQALAVVDSWLNQPNVTFVRPGPDYWRLFTSCWQQSRGSSQLVTDASIAALALEFGLIVYSNDTDFASFSGLAWKNPLK